MTNRFDLYIYIYIYFEFRHVEPRKKKTRRKGGGKKKRRKEYLCPLPPPPPPDGNFYVTAFTWRSKRFKGNIRTILLISSKLGERSDRPGGYHGRFKLQMATFLERVADKFIGDRMEMEVGRLYSFLSVLSFSSLPPCFFPLPLYRFYIANYATLFLSR